MAEQRSDLPESQDDADPNEEVAADGCEVDVTDAEYQVSDQEMDGADASEFRFSDELDDGMVMTAEPIIRSPIDGLPAPADQGDLRTAPPFTHHTMCCVEDQREYVEELLERGYVALDHFRQRNRYDLEGTEVEPKRFSPEQVKRYWGRYCVSVTEEGGDSYWLPVRPIRERCRHYMRQVMNNDEVVDEEAFGHRIVFRNCAARRSVGGALMSLRDTAVYACDYRDPPDPKTTDKYLDGPDRERLISQAHLIRVPAFGLAKAAEPAKKDPTQ